MANKYCMAPIIFSQCPVGQGPRDVTAQTGHFKETGVYLGIHPGIRGIAHKQGGLTSQREAHRQTTGL